MPNEVYLPNQDNPPNSIKVDGQCFQLDGTVLNLGQQTVSADSEYNSCELCQAVAPAASICGDYTCSGGEPNIRITVSGGIWEAVGSGQGPFSPGVHCICPNVYSNTASTQYWKLGSPFSDDGIKFSVNTATPISKATFNVNYVADTASYNTGVTGDIKDRLFQTYTANGITVTFERGSFW